jgi:hypothetical protein
MWIAVLLILAVVFIIFFGTIAIKGTSYDEDVWVKVKLNINSDMKAGWCRVIPGRSVNFYDIEGYIIDQKINRVSIVEPCLESGVQHPIPSDNISKLMNGEVDESLSTHNPFANKNKKKDL